MNAHTPAPGSVKPLNTRQLAKAATRAKVLSSAKCAFETCGYERADMRTIAAWACVSTGAIFGHFSGKAELYREVYGHDPISPESGRELLELLRAIDALGVMEINPSNYDHELVCELSNNAVQAALIARAAIALATTPTALASLRSEKD